MNKSLKLVEKKTICEETGEITRAFTVDGVACPKYILTDRISKQRAGYDLIELDLVDVRSWLAEAFKLVGPPPQLDKNQDKFILVSHDSQSIILQAVWFSAIIVYAKCFTQAEGRGVKLERSMLPEHLRKSHDSIMEFRNTIVAHAGAGGIERAHVELVLSPPPTLGHLWLRGTVHRLNFADDRHQPASFETLVEWVYQHVLSKKRKLDKKIFEEVKKNSLVQLYAKANLNR